eukprot:1149422-Pelagomonas_calceolata.AAC.15
MAQGRVFRFNSVEGPDTTNEGLTAQHVQPLLNAAFKVRVKVQCLACLKGWPRAQAVRGELDVYMRVIGMISPSEDAGYGTFSSLAWQYPV